MSEANHWSIPDQEPPPEPPYDEAALDAAADAMDAASKHLRAVKTKAQDLRILEEARALLRAEKVTESDYDTQFLTRTELAELTAPEPLIEKVLPRHSYVILRGRDHSFKSFVALDWTACLATGKAWQGHQITEPVRVLYIAGEGAHGLRKRLDSWEYAWQRKIPDTMLTIRRTALNMHQPGPAFDHLLNHVRAGGYGLVVVDTLRRVSGAADGNSSEMGAVIDNLDRIKQATDAGSVLTVAHTDKGDNDTRGYSGIEDDADVVWAAKRDQMFLELTLTKMKDGPDGRTLHLEAQRSDAGSLVLAGLSSRPSIDTSDNEQKIVDALREESVGGMSFSRLREATGLADSSLGRAIKSLHENGSRIQNIGTSKRPIWDLPALDLTPNDSHDTEPEIHAQHAQHSHELPLPLPTTPITPTPLRGGSSGSESGSNTPEETP